MSTFALRAGRQHVGLDNVAKTALNTNSYSEMRGPSSLSFSLSLPNLYFSRPTHLPCVKSSSMHKKTSSNKPQRSTKNFTIHNYSCQSESNLQSHTWPQFYLPKPLITISSIRGQNYASHIATGYSQNRTCDRS